MEKKSTGELSRILGSTSGEAAGEFLAANASSLLTDSRPFSAYMHEMLRLQGKTQQEVFVQADIPERYGYKLLSEEKHTRQRDYILRICIAAGMNLDQTDRALTLYGMARLYPRIPRDAVLMIALNRGMGSVLDVNALLEAHGLPPLRSCGSLD